LHRHESPSGLIGKVSCTYVEAGAIEISGHVARLFPPGKISCICATFFPPPFLSRSFIRRIVLTHPVDFVPRAAIRIQRRETRKDRRILPLPSFRPRPSHARQFFVAFPLSRSLFFFVALGSCLRLVCLRKTTRIQFHVGKLSSESERGGRDIKQTLTDNYIFDIFSRVDFFVFDIAVWNSKVERTYSKGTKCFARAKKIF